MAKDYHCGCGAWLGESCEWSGPLREMVIVEYMPEGTRSSHRTAGNLGVYPYNGSERVLTNKECAERLLPCGGRGCRSDDCDCEWSSIVAGPKKQYAEADDD